MTTSELQISSVLECFEWLSVVFPKDAEQVFFTQTYTLKYGIACPPYRANPQTPRDPLSDVLNHAAPTRPHPDLQGAPQVS